MTVDSSVTAAECQWGPGDLPRNRLTESCYLLLVLTGSDIFFGSQSLGLPTCLGK